MVRAEELDTLLLVTVGVVKIATIPPRIFVSLTSINSISSSCAIFIVADTICIFVIGIGVTLSATPFPSLTVQLFPGDFIEALLRHELRLHACFLREAEDRLDRAVI